MPQTNPTHSYMIKADSQYTTSRYADRELLTLKLATTGSVIIRSAGFIKLRCHYRILTLQIEGKDTHKSVEYTRCRSTSVG